MRLNVASFQIRYANASVFRFASSYHCNLLIRNSNAPFYVEMSTATFAPSAVYWTIKLISFQFYLTSSKPHTPCIYEKQNKRSCIEVISKFKHVACSDCIKPDTLYAIGIIQFYSTLIYICNLIQRIQGILVFYSYYHGKYLISRCLRLSRLCGKHSDKEVLKSSDLTILFYFPRKFLFKLIILWYQSKFSKIFVIKYTWLYISLFKNHFL